MVALFLGLIVISAFFSLILIVISAIGLWKMFTKAGEEGWKAIVPIYNLYTLTTLVGLSEYWFIIILGVTILAAIVSPLAPLASLVYIYFGIILAGSITKSFNKSEMFGFGLFFFTPIFYLILGLDSSKYEGKKPMQDPVMDFINENILHKEESKVKEATVVEEKDNKTKYCTNCGAKLESDSEYCTSCGTKVK